MKSEYKAKPISCAACPDLKTKLQASYQVHTTTKQNLREERNARHESERKLQEAEQRIEQLDSELWDTKEALRKKEVRLATIVRCCEEEAEEVGAKEQEDAQAEVVVPCMENEESLSLD